MSDARLLKILKDLRSLADTTLLNKRQSCCYSMLIFLKSNVTNMLLGVVVDSLGSAFIHEKSMILSVF